MPSPTLFERTPFIIEEIELGSDGTSLSNSNAATPPDPIDQAFAECLVAAETTTEFTQPLQPATTLVPPTAPCSALSTPFWSSTPVTGDSNNLYGSLNPWPINGLITPLTGYGTMGYPSLDNNDNMMSVPLPQNTWSTGPTGNDQGQYQTYTPGYQGTYNASTSPHHDQIPRTAYTAPTSPQTFGAPGPDRHSYAPHARKRSATINTVSTLQSGSPSTPAHTNYPYPSHRPDLSRQTSVSSMMSSLAMPMLPEAQSKEVFHPAPSLHPSQTSIDLDSLTYPDGLNIGAGGGGMLFHPQQYGFGDGFGYGGGEAKPARFKPTKEQLELLIRSYNENKNPDAATREALARQLGPDVKPKTLQIWFQNRGAGTPRLRLDPLTLARRSKSRAKERESNLPKRLDMKGRTTPPGRGGSMNIKRNVDVEALRQLVHDDDPTLLLIPITVLSIATWTRFLTPGIGYTLPDLGCSVSLSISPVINLYVVHKSETFKIVIPINTHTMSNIQGTSNPVLNNDAVAMKFDLTPNCAHFMGWHKGMDGRGGWQVVGDFTSGEAGNGGKVEVTGEKNALLNAFTRIHGLLESLPTPLASSRSGHSSQGQFGNLSQTWNFPNTASTFGESFAPGSAVGSQAPLSGVGMDFLSLNPPASTSSATKPHMRHQSLSVSGGEFKHPGMTQRHHSSHSVNLPAQPSGTLSAQGEQKLDQMLGLPWTTDEYTVPPPQNTSPDQQWPRLADAPASAQPQASGAMAGTNQGSHSRTLSVQSGTSGTSFNSMGFSNFVSDKYEYEQQDGMGQIQPIQESSTDDGFDEREEGVADGERGPNNRLGPSLSPIPASEDA